MAGTKKSRNQADWQRIAERMLKQVLKAGREIPAIRKLGPKQDWKAELSLVGSAAMTELNSAYRGKAYPTDVLSFPPPEVFRATGHLGELVLCLPTLKRQAREAGHSMEEELQVLLVHGVLHLLGLDHELGPEEAKRMAALEDKLLAAGAKVSGLIKRSGY